MNKANTPEVRKPRPIDIDDYILGGIELARFGGLVYLTRYEMRDKPYMNAKDCRKLAAWLIKSAEYLEYKEGK